MAGDQRIVDFPGHHRLRGPLGAEAAAGLLEKSVPHRVPSERRAAQGHVMDARASVSGALPRRAPSERTSRDVLGALNPSLR